MKSALAWIAWTLLAFAAALPGALWPPGEWYASLAKPDWTPPGWAFPTVWTTLYVCMGTAAWLVHRERRAGREVWGPLSLFLVQLALNAAWTPVFFGMHAMFGALLLIGVLWFAILATALAFRRVSVAAALLFVPYLAWVSVATVLNYRIWDLNT